MTQKVWDTEEEEGISGEVLEGANSWVDLDHVEQDMVHHYVLNEHNCNGRLGYVNPFTSMHSWHKVALMSPWIVSHMLNVLCHQ